jgi:glycosyltransferase involved in cell wall biosynthesis
VEDILSQEGLAGRAVLAGLRRDAPQLLSAMDIFMLTSLWEGLPRTIPEAQAMGLPVVANCIDGASEAVQDGISGYLCRPGDLEGMAERVIDLIDHPARCAAMGEQGRSAALAEFDLHKMIDEIESLYQRLLET